MRFRRAFCLSVALVGLFAATILAGVPPVINYQGILLDSGGDPVTTPVTVSFGIYDDPTAGTLLWHEVRSVSPDTQGRFNILLGEFVALVDGIFAGPNRWLEIEVMGDPPMSPRVQIVTVAYAHRISTVDGSTGGIISGDVAIQSDLTVSGKATIGNGHTNASPGGFVAGAENYVDGSQSAIGGGNFNGASGAQATVGGGYLNVAVDDRAAVSGGHHNLADLGAMVGGGGYNYARGEYSSISGGGGSAISDSNSAPGDYSSVGGGRRNVAGNVASTVGGGVDNTASGIEATVSGGDNNEASNTNASVGGGTNNRAGGIESTVAGGSNNIAYGYLAAIGGGTSNDATGGSAITVAGGWNNTASAGYSSISGGKDNTASGDYSTVGGGLENSAEDPYSTVSGGRDNRASGQYSTVGGGYGNICNGLYSVIPGGDQDTITSTGHHSMAFGRGVYITNNYRVVFFNGSNSGRLGINRDGRDIGPNYPIHVGTDATNGNGAYLTTGGVWTNSSSREFKENFQPIDGEGLLAKIARMPIETWQYKNSTERHIGPVAEDFVGAFDVGTVDDDGRRNNQYLSPGDIAGVALAAIQELHRKNTELQAANEAMKEQMAEMQMMLQRLLASQQ